MAEDIDLQYPTSSFFARVLCILLPFTAFVVLLYSVLVFTSITMTEDYVVNGYLDQEVQRFEQSYAWNSTQAPLPSTSYMHSYWANDENLPFGYRNLLPGSHELDDERTHVRVAYIAAAGQNLYVELDESQLSALGNHISLLCSILWGVAGLVMIAGAFLAVVGARHLALPLTRLADAVKAGNLTDRDLPGHERLDEIGTLSRALTELVNRLYTALNRERAFTRHASHELRTPLAVMRNALAVIRLPHCSEEKRARNLDRLEQSSSEMEMMVQLFLCLGREDEHLPTQPILLRPLLETCLQNFEGRLSSKYQHVDLRVASDASIEAAPNALQVLVSNLIGNAVQHGETYLRIESNNSSLTLTNALPAGESGTSGFGYGLDISRRLSSHCGWALEVLREPGYFSVRIHFSNEQGAHGIFSAVKPIADHS